ncbi:MAG: O-antigen ligase family protein [Actinomycetota bacterium]
MAERRTAALFAAMIVASGLAVDPWGWDRYGPLRWALLSTLGLVLIAQTAEAGILRWRSRPWFERWGAGLLLVGAGVSTLLSPDVLHAVIGTPDRHFGLLTWLVGIGVFVGMASAVSVPLVAVGRSAAGVAASLGSWTALELADIGWFDSSFADGRSGGPFGQPAYLGAAAILFAGVGSVLLVREERERVVSDQYLAIGGLCGGVVAVAGSGSRAALVGALVAVTVVVTRSAFVRRHVTGAVLSGLAVAGVVAVSPMGDRVLDALRGTRAVESRVDEWVVGLRALADAPGFGLIGWGPESYRTVFGAHVDDGYVIRYGREVITDRAHSGPIDIALSVGWVGALGWALLVLGVCRAAWRGERGDAVTTALLAGVAGYLAQQLLLFPLAEVDLILMGVVGLLAARARPASPPRPRRMVVAVPAAALAALAAVAGIADVAADRAVAATPVDAASARSLRPDSIRYRFISARAEDRGTIDSLRRSLDHVLDGRDLSEADPALRLEEAALRVELARVGGDPDDVEAALDVTGRFLADDPRHPQLLMQHGIARALDGDLDGAVTPLRRATELAPNAVEPVVNLALVLSELGREAEAIAALEEAALRSPGDPVVAELLREISGR